MMKFFLILMLVLVNWSHIWANIPSCNSINECEPPYCSKIEEIIDENVRPALAGDGGGLEVLAYQDGVLTVHYQGACGSCPSASAGTLYAIQNLLQRMLDPKIQVVSV